MNHLIQKTKRKGKEVALILVTVGGLTACSDLMEVSLPASLTEQVLEDAASAENQVFSVMAFFECSYSDLTHEALGFEDLWERLTGVSAPADYDYATSSGSCDGSDSNAAYYRNLQVSRVMGENVYERLTNDWTDADVPGRAKLQALAALYVAANIEVLGTFFCDMTFDAGPMQSPTQVLSLGETWLTTAMGHITALGDFPIDNGISTSAMTVAWGLKARIKWLKGDLPGALADLANVPQGFEAVVSRETGPQRRTKVFSAGLDNPWSGMYPGPFDWWVPQAIVVDKNNPITGVPWANPIPFTGYVDIGLLADGRAVRADGLPIRVGVDAGAVTETDAGGRVPLVVQLPLGGTVLASSPSKYLSEGDDIPWISWREMWLIAAEAEGGQLAIDRVNDLRTFHGLPLVTYLTGASSAQDIRYMIIEERRRELFAEGGRFWATKLQNLDLLWFPRNQGVMPTQGWSLFGGVRVLMDTGEYTENPNLSLDSRGTGCTVAEGRPILRG
jgi:hypothetical protein